MPVPELDIIKDMGKKVLQTKDFSEQGCDLIMEEYYG